VGTPIGIKLISIAFGIWPASWLGILVYALWSDYEAGRFASEDLNLLLIEILFCLVLIFMLSAVAIGLWKLEEGARKVALISCSVFLVVGISGLTSVIRMEYAGGPDWIAILWLGSWSVGFAVSAWYLHSRRIKAAFNRIETLGLTSS
jgi:hypothetical protein